MALLEKHLVVKKSTLSKVGKGLFTKIDIKKGTRIVEYKGQIMTWKQVEDCPEERNGYVFYVNKNHCIDAWKTKKSVAHYANDAKGMVRIKGVKNNSVYQTENKRCYIEATKNIAKGSEIFVDYGKEYWETVRSNLQIKKNKNNSKDSKKSK